MVTREVALYPPVVCHGRGRQLISGYPSTSPPPLSLSSTHTLFPKSFLPLPLFSLPSSSSYVVLTFVSCSSPSLLVRYPTSPSPVFFPFPPSLPYPPPSPQALRHTPFYAHSPPCLYSPPISIPPPFLSSTSPPTFSHQIGL